MILVDIYVPVMDETYDFYLDEKMEVGILIQQIADMICQKEQCPVKGDIGNLTLWNTEIRCRLSRGSTLKESGVDGGDRLMLV